MMGHNPSSFTLKNVYAGRYENLDMTRLLHTGEGVTVDLPDPLLSPSIFRIKDIRRYALTDEEIETGVEQHEDVILLNEKVKQYIIENCKFYGSDKRSKWSSDDKKQLQTLRTQLKRRRRLLKIQLTREKFVHLTTLLENCLVLDSNNNLVLDEDLIQIPKRSVEIDKDNASTDDRAEEEEADDVQNEEDEDDIEAEILYEEDQAADCARSTLSPEIPTEDTVITSTFEK